MFILNDRMEEIKTGSPTSRHCSVIDYVLIYTDFLYKICKLEMSNFCKLCSDIPFPLSLQLYTNDDKKDKKLTNTLRRADQKVNKWKNEK